MPAPNEHIGKIGNKEVGQRLRNYLHSKGNYQRG